MELNPFKKREKACQQWELCKKRKNIEEQQAKQVLTTGKVQEQLGSEKSASSSTTVREQFPPLMETEKKWAQAVQKDAVQKIAKGIIDEVLQDVLTEVIGTIKIEMEEEVAPNIPVGRDRDPEVDAAIASILRGPERDISDIPAGITGECIRLPTVAIPGLEEMGTGGVSPSQLSDSVQCWMMEGKPVDPLVVQGVKPPTPSFCSPQYGKSFESISPADTPKHTPRYGGIPSGLEPERPAQLQEAVGMVYTHEVAARRGDFQPTELPEMTMEEIQMSPILSPRARHRRESKETIKYSPVPTEEDTSIKESTMESPPAKG